MAERHPQSVAKLVVFRAYLASDGKTPATGKTIAITISKNGATSFSNPAAGATNATEMASGFYKFSLGTGDLDTLGPLAWRGAEGTINDAGDVIEVVTPNVDANIKAVSDDATAADKLEEYLDGTHFMPVDAHKPNWLASGQNLIVKEPDGSTTAYTKTNVTTDPSAVPITGAS